MNPSFAAWLTVALLAAVLAISGCSRKERLLFDGNYYPAKERGISKDDRNAFEVSVRRADQGLAGAREAGRHAGSRYCIENFGTSQIEWVQGPDDPDESLQLSNGALRLSGRCVTW